MVHEAMDGEHTYSTLIDDVQPDSITVQTPTIRRELVRVPVGTPVKVYLREGAAAFVFETEILGHSTGATPQTRLAAPANVQRIEQRRHYRLQITLAPSSADVVPIEGEDEARAIRAVITDISGGGVGFISPRRVEAGRHVRFVIPLPPRSDLNAEVRLIGFEEPEYGRFNYRYHAEFVNLSEGERDRIIRFVFRQQLILRRQGVI
jgi:c-di-GMP-binding flagellar brake protein YcgR